MFQSVRLFADSFTSTSKKLKEFSEKNTLAKCSLSFCAAFNTETQKRNIFLGKICISKLPIKTVKTFLDIPPFISLSVLVRKETLPSLQKVFKANFFLEKKDTTNPTPKQKSDYCLIISIIECGNLPCTEKPCIEYLA